MKRLILVTLFALVGSVYAMEKEAEASKIIDKSKITYESEERSFLLSVPNSPSDNAIRAFYDRIPIGKATYRSHYNHENCNHDDISQCHQYSNCWELDYLHVASDYRNNRIGFELFKRCIDEMRKKNCKTLIWEARPFGGIATVEKLTDIYQKMIKKLENVKEIKAKKHPNGELAVMGIELNQSDGDETWRQ